jgi:threonine/homoserine/homoserine lactone efflux protein
MTITPGPNNTFVMISGAKFGIWKTIPLILGIAIGLGLQLIALGMGLNKIFELIPEINIILSILGSSYIIWLAWKIATSGTLKIDITEKPSMGFIEGAIFQWLNPKAWIFSISIIDLLRK